MLVNLTISTTLRPSVLHQTVNGESRSAGEGSLNLTQEIVIVGFVEQESEIGSDVYKRQTFDARTAGAARGGWESFREDQNAAPDYYEETYEAVSYTHLDVYKRQGSTTASGAVRRSSGWHRLAA